MRLKSITIWRDVTPVIELAFVANQRLYKGREMSAKTAKTDQRIRRTRRILRKADLDLEKDYSAISIKEITDRADVAYITFFRHYNGIDELLMEILDGDGRIVVISKH
jgi:AcrR family transcriptional regulator